MRDDDDGSATEEIKLYPLNVVPSLIFIFKKNMEKDALCVIGVRKVMSILNTMTITYLVFYLIFFRKNSRVSKSKLFDLTILMSFLVLTNQIIFLMTDMRQSRMDEKQAVECLLA